MFQSFASEEKYVQYSPRVCAGNVLHYNEILLDLETLWADVFDRLSV